MGLNYYASSPTVVLPPQQPSRYFANCNPSHHQPLPPLAAGNFRPKYPTPPSLNYLAAASNATAGRKRSIADVDPDDHSPDGSVVRQLPPKPKLEPIYGPGMTLIYPDEPGLNISAESQTGTWCEEKHETTEKQAPAVRPVAVSRKSQRLDSKSDVSAPSMQRPTESIIDDKGNTIDVLIKSLGVGWKNIMTNPTLRDAARAYARVIENHFDLTDPLIMLESEALSAYLVRAKQYGVEKYWLFDDSLRWCQLVGWSLQKTVENLMARPGPVIEGERIESSPRTPSTEPVATPLQDIEMSGPKDIMMAEDDAMQL